MTGNTNNSKLYAAVKENLNNMEIPFNAEDWHEMEKQLAVKSETNPFAIFKKKSFAVILISISIFTVSIFIYISKENIISRFSREDAEETIIPNNQSVELPKTNEKNNASVLSNDSIIVLSPPQSPIVETNTITKPKAIKKAAIDTSSLNNISAKQNESTNNDFDFVKANDSIQKIKTGVPANENVKIENSLQDSTIKK